MRGLVCIIVLLIFGFSDSVYSQKANDYRAKAYKGEAIGQMRLGLCFELGRGVEKNLDSAYFWYERSARRGLAQGQVLLASCYREGKGCERDSNLAKHWYELAAMCNSAVGLDGLGDCYNYGIGVDKDAQKAIDYYKQAMDKGYAKSEEKYLQLIRNKQD